MDPLLWLDRLFGTAPWFPYVVWLVLFAIAIGFMIRAIRRAWRPLKWLIQRAENLDELPKFMKDTTKSIDEIHHETHKNDGSSIKDSTIRIEAGVAGLYVQIETLKLEIVKLSEADEAAAEKIRVLESTLTPAELERLKQQLRGKQ